MAEVRYPWAACDVQALTAGATVAATVSKCSILQVGSAALTAAFTLNLTLGASLNAGDFIIVTWLSDGTARHMTSGTGFKGALQVNGTISKTTTALFIYDGSAFHCIGSSVQT